jgi:hypothetical protein
MRDATDLHSWTDTNFNVIRNQASEGGNPSAELMTKVAVAALLKVRLIKTDRPEHAIREAGTLYRFDRCIVGWRSIGPDGGNLEGQNDYKNYFIQQRRQRHYYRTR